VKILLLKGDTVASSSVGAHGTGSYQLSSLIKSTPPGTYRIKIIGNDMTAVSRIGAQFNISYSTADGNMELYNLENIWGDGGARKYSVASR